MRTPVVKNRPPVGANPKVVDVTTPDHIDDKVYIFISYAKADHEIAEALRAELLDVNAARVECFLDTESIESGSDWRKTLNEFLGKADWLICIYTGIQSDFCGYEVGVFAAENESQAGERDSRIVCLHDTLPVPTLFAARQGTYVESLPRSVKTDEPIKEYFLKTRLAKLLSDIYNYKDLYVQADPEVRRNKLARQTGVIVGVFDVQKGGDILSDTPVQDQIEVTIVAGPDGEITAIPDDAAVVGTFGSFRLLGLQPPTVDRQLPVTNWKAVRSFGQSRYASLAPWVERLEKDMLLIASGRVPTRDEALFATDNKVYQAFLARHVVLKNGTHIFTISMVETASRQFSGNRTTSLILAGIVTAARFRFEYLEDKNILSNRFDNFLPLSQFQINCWQFHYDLDRLRHEAIELGILDPVEFVKAFGEAKRGFAENLLTTSLEARKVLYQTLPAGGDTVDEASRPKIRDAIYAYFATIEPVNIDFLVEALDVLRQQFEAEQRQAATAQALEKKVADLQEAGVH